MANIVLKTYAAGDNNQGSVTPQNDALIYQAAVPVNGLFFGGAITLSSANVLHVAAGMGIIGGRFFEVLESDISVQLSASGDLLGRLYIHLDLSNADNPIEINAVTGASLPALQGDPDLNISNGVFDMELCTFSINELTISNIIQTFPTITTVNNQIRRATAYSANDFVLCQSASDALIFICTTAGTTAVQEPTAYASVASGSSVTDGTAVFKAYNLYSWIEGKAPKSHASTGTTYGIGTTTKYGHCMTINGLTQSSHADGKALSAYQGKVLNDKISKTEVLASNAQQMIAPILSSLVAPTGGLASGDQFIYNGLLYKATAAIAQGGTITIDGNCEIADSVTEQIKSTQIVTSATVTVAQYPKLDSNVSINKCGKIVMIYINGFKNLSSGQNASVFKIPDGFRPLFGITFDAYPPTAPSEVYRVALQSNGNVNVYAYNSVTHANLVAQITVYISD